MISLLFGNPIFELQLLSQNFILRLSPIRKLYEVCFVRYSMDLLENEQSAHLQSDFDTLRPLARTMLQFLPPFGSFV
jgi:hypothetical protein